VGLGAWAFATQPRQLRQRGSVEHDTPTDSAEVINSLSPGLLSPDLLATGASSTETVWGSRVDGMGGRVDGASTSALAI
jgi:hypothetical protein